MLYLQKAIPIIMYLYNPQKAICRSFNYAKQEFQLIYTSSVRVTLKKTICTAVFFPFFQPIKMNLTHEIQNFTSA